MNTNEIRERLRAATIKLAAMEADNPALLLMSSPAHQMVRSEIASLKLQLDHAMNMAAQEASNGNSHQSAS